MLSRQVELSRPTPDRPKIRPEGRRMIPIDSKSLQVLVVDDDEVSRELVTELLKAAGYEVTIARDGSEALGMAAAKVFDLVLMDLDMPVMDGLAATRAIRQLPGLARSVTIVILTGRSSDDDRRAALHAGANGFVTKPFRIINIAPWLDAELRRK